MISKIAFVAALVAVCHAGHEAPPPKAHTYSVPSVAKVSYPAPTITKSVETYSAPSIEKTTTIVRTITAPLNAPPVKSIQYTAPAAPVLKAALAPAVYAAPSFAAPVGYAAAAPVAYAAAPAYAAYAAPAVQKVIANPGLAYSVPSYSYAAPSVYSAYAPHGAGVTTYGSPSLGYSLGTVAAAPAAVLKTAHTHAHAEYAH